MADNPKPDNKKDKKDKPGEVISFTKEWADKLDKEVARDKARAKNPPNPRRRP